MEDQIDQLKNKQADSIELYELIKLVLLDQNMKPEEKKILIDELRKNNSATSDRWTFRWAIYFLGSTVILSLIFVYCLAYHGCDIPEGLIAIGSTVAGGIAGLLSPIHRTKN